MELKTDNWLRTHGFTGIEMPITTDGQSIDVTLYIGGELQDEFCVFVQPKEIERLGNTLYDFVRMNTPLHTSYEVFIAEVGDGTIKCLYSRNGYATSRPNL